MLKTTSQLKPRPNGKGKCQYSNPSDNTGIVLCSVRAGPPVQVSVLHCLYGCERVKKRGD